ncbi:MAG TPA: Lrp/AsnC family transcriptional regulator [Symbiobacteriaceae bacterium]|nr:Lrp/AsnC family transcriptional regulator [Symbiobacteriaceae bacterium]
MDDIDMSIIRQLSANSRISWADLGAAVGITRQTAAERVQKLEQAGVIRGYTISVDAEAVGADLLAFVALSLERPEHGAPFLAAVAALPEVMECHHVAGEDSYLMKVRTDGTRGLERLITDHLRQIPGVVRTRTTIVLSSSKETAVPPFPATGNGK